MNHTATLAMAATAALALACGKGESADDGCWLRDPPAEVSARASQHDSVAISLGSGTVKVCYGRPQRHGRQIMGQLVPYGTPWRMGADEATVIHVPFRASIAGVAVEPGWYSLYVVPDTSQWKVFVNGDARRWGIPITDPVRARDVGSGTVDVERADPPVDTLTIRLERGGPSSATMSVAWSDTRVKIPIAVR